MQGCTICIVIVKIGLFYVYNRKKPLRLYRSVAFVFHWYGTAASVIPVDLQACLFFNTHVNKRYVLRYEIETQSNYKGCCKHYRFYIC